MCKDSLPNGYVQTATMNIFGESFDCLFHSVMFWRGKQIFSIPAIGISFFLHPEIELIAIKDDMVVGVLKA